MNGLDETIQQPKSIETLRSGNLQADFVIAQLTRERDKLDQQLTDQVKKNESLQEKLNKTERDFEKFQNDQRLLEIQNAKPTGLNGILESSAGTKLVEICEPLIKDYFESLRTPAAISGAENSPMYQLGMWFKSMPLEVQQSVWKMLQAMTYVEHEKLGPFCQAIVKNIVSEYPAAQGEQKAS